MEMKDIIEQQATLALNSGGVVTINRHFGTVAIDWTGGECFMQGDEADQFIDAVDALSDNNPDVDFDKCALSEAWPYIETLGA